MSDKPSPLDQLTEEQKTRLRQLSSEVRLDKITVSFSVDDRDARGRRKSAFYSVTASRGHGAEVQEFHSDAPGAPFTVEDAKLVRCLVSKHVVSSVYSDAVQRGIMSANEAREEARAILAGYDNQIVRALTGKNGT
jgi:hypothetical protein